MSRRLAASLPIAGTCLIKRAYEISDEPQNHNQPLQHCFARLSISNGYQPIPVSTCINYTTAHAITILNHHFGHLQDVPFHGSGEAAKESQMICSIPERGSSAAESFRRSLLLQQHLERGQG